MGSHPETCLVCLKNNFDDKTLILFDLSTQEWENVTYLNKLRYVMNADIVIYESTLICSSCLNDLNKAYEFRERVVRALDYWCVMFEDNVTIEKKSNQQVQNNDISNISEINAYDEDNIKTGLTELKNTELNESNETGHPNTEDNNDAQSDCASFPCSKCNEVFPTASELIHHNCGTSSSKIKKNRLERKPKPRKRMKKQKEDIFECEHCDLSFTKRWMLTKHLRAHTVDKKYTCTFCNRAFKQSYHLREHITSHTGERNYNCDMCGKSFQRLSSQRRHMRTHVAPPGQKAKKSPFLCNICGKSFPYSNGAQRHMRIHTGDKKYECNICSRKFNQSTHLRVHLRTHTGERPYMCNTCGESFSLKASLDKHMKSLHTLKESNESKNDVKIFQNLEPNLSQTECRDDDDDDLKRSEYDNNDLQMYNQGFLVVCNQ